MKAIFLLTFAACRADTGPGSSADTDTDAGTDTDPSVGLEEGFESELTRVGGCADVLVFAVNEADTVMLSVLFDHPLAGAGYADTASELDLPHPSVAVEVSLGTSVSGLTCTDDATGSVVVVERWRGGEGHVSLSLDLDEAAPESDPRADVTLSDLRLRPAYETAELELALFTWTDIAVGWLAGR